MRETVIKCDVCGNPASEYIYSGAKACAEDDGVKTVDLCSEHAEDLCRTLLSKCRSSEEAVIFEFLSKGRNKQPLREQPMFRMGLGAI